MTTKTSQMDELAYRCRRQVCLIKTLKAEIRLLPLCPDCRGKIQVGDPCVRCENQTMARVLTEIARDWHSNPGAYQAIAKRTLRALGKAVP